MANIIDLEFYRTYGVILFINESNQPDIRKSVNKQKINKGVKNV